MQRQNNFPLIKFIVCLWTDRELASLGAKVSNIMRHTVYVTSSHDRRNETKKEFSTNCLFRIPAPISYTVHMNSLFLIHL